MKNKLYSDAEFQESLDRSLSSLQPDRLMARRIIASGKEEEKVKKIPRLAIVIAVILVLTMATAIAAHIAGWTRGLEELLQVTDELKEKHEGPCECSIPHIDHHETQRANKEVAIQRHHPSHPRPMKDFFQIVITI